MKRILFHGTSKKILAFNADSIGLGADPNSALGVHTTDSPNYAADYAEMSLALDQVDYNSSEPKVLVLSYNSENQEHISSYEDFYGDHDEGTNNKKHFCQLRKDLLEDCIDLVEFEAGEEPITTLLSYEKINIIGELSVDQAIELSERLNLKSITWDMPEAILREVEKFGLR